MNYTELFDYLKDDLRRARALMNSGTATEEALELYDGVITIAKPIQISPKNKGLIIILADAYEGKHHALTRLGKEEEAKTARQKCAELSELLKPKELH